jgi:hypothetical protein
MTGKLNASLFFRNKNKSYSEDITKELLVMMKHTVQLKLPRLWGKKKNDADVVTEIDLEGKEQDISTALLIAAPLVIGCTIGYLVGFKAGVQKGGTNIIVMKD